MKYQRPKLLNRQLVYEAISRSQEFRKHLMRPAETFLASGREQSSSQCLQNGVVRDVHGAVRRLNLTDQITDSYIFFRNTFGFGSSPDREAVAELSCRRNARGNCDSISRT